MPLEPIKLQEFDPRRRIPPTIPCTRSARESVHTGPRVDQFITRISCIIQTFHVRVSHRDVFWLSSRFSSTSAVSPCTCSCSPAIDRVSSSIGLGFTSVLASGYRRGPPAITGPYFSPTRGQRQILRARLIIMLNCLSRIEVNAHGHRDPTSDRFDLAAGFECVPIKLVAHTFWLSTSRGRRLQRWYVG